MKESIENTWKNKRKGDCTITIINYNEVQGYKIKQLIDLAGFNTITNNNSITLVDKSHPNADNYADLRFRDLKEAVAVINPYLKRIKFKIIL